MNQIFAQLFYEMEKHRDTVLVTLIDTAGSAPRKSGSQMLVGASGRLTGTIGGGAVERRSEEMAMALLREKRSAVHDFLLHTAASGGDIGRGGLYGHGDAIRGGTVHSDWNQNIESGNVTPIRERQSAFDANYVNLTTNR